MMEKWIRRERPFTGRIFSLVVGEVALDDGRTARREIIEHNGGVAIVPVLDDAVILIRQFRIAIGKTILELPAGRLEGDEEPEQRARLELAEEIGYRAGKMRLAHTYFSAAGFTNEPMHIFLAFDLEWVGQNLEEEERIELVRLPLADIQEWLVSGKIEDAKTLIGLNALRLREVFPPPNFPIQLADVTKRI